VVYQYDSLNRLTLAQTTNSSAWGQAFVYDGFGNLYQKNVTQGSAPTLSVSVNAATNQISGQGYDANGNTVGTSGSYPVIYAYDVENRMVSVNFTQNTGGVPSVLYAYDSGNRRVWKGTVNSSGVITAQEMYYYGADGKKLGTYVARFNPPPYSSYWTATDLQVHFGARRVAHWAEAYEPSGEDFLSPCLAEADVMRRVLSQTDFAKWLSDFLPGISSRRVGLDEARGGGRPDGRKARPFGRTASQPGLDAERNCRSAGSGRCSHSIFTSDCQTTCRGRTSVRNRRAL